MQSIKSVSLTGFNEVYSTLILVLLRPIERLAYTEFRNFIFVVQLQIQYF